MIKLKKTMTDQTRNVLLLKTNKFLAAACQKCRPWKVSPDKTSYHLAYLDMSKQSFLSTVFCFCYFEVFTCHHS